MSQSKTAVHSCATQIGGNELCITTGELAQQAGGAVLVQYGETVVLGTATIGKPLRPDANFMPLLVDYEEKFYAAGKIKGSRFVKREGRPTDEAILAARLIDRAIRPLFPDDMINDIQIVCTVLSYDGENDPDILAVTAAAAALMVSDVPWQGPLATVRVGYIKDKFVINPTVEEREESTLDLVVAGTGERVVMIEAGAKEMSEDKMLDAIEEAQKALALITPTLEEIATKAGRAKREPILIQRDPEVVRRLKAQAQAILPGKLKGARSKADIGKAERETAAEILEKLSETERETIKESAVHEAVHDFHAEYFRENVLKSGWRADGRRLDEIRPLHIRTGILPRTHGSALFQRGETQILTTLTLGGPSDVLLLDTMEVEAKKRYIHYYNFPAYSVGEIKPSRGPGRREIGHGALAERALIPVLPAADKWPPYTMMLVSEALQSHGSTSMASVCGSTLALLDGGVPISKPVAGIAMGLVSDGKENFKILTDIAGLEDEKGDMDIKVAGTRDGITAIQMDTKITGLNRDILSQGLDQARRARLEILEAMQAVLAEPRSDLSPYAPRIVTLKVDPEKIGDLIGPRGKHINAMIEETGVDIDIEDDGTVSITSNDAGAMEKAQDWVRNMTREIKPGERFEGKVTRLMNFGAFVELLPGIEGMVHISQFRDEHVGNIHDVAKVGDMIPVVVIEVDQMGRINLSHKAAMEGGTIDPAKFQNSRPRPSRRPRDSFRGPRPPR